MSKHHHGQDHGGGCDVEGGDQWGVQVHFEDDGAERVAALCEETRSLWRDALPDGDLVVRLVEGLRRRVERDTC